MSELSKGFIRFAGFFVLSYCVAGSEDVSEIRSLDGAEFMPGQRMILDGDDRILTQDVYLVADEIEINSKILLDKHSLVLETGKLILGPHAQFETFQTAKPSVPDSTKEAPGRGTSPDGQFISHTVTIEVDEPYITKDSKGRRVRATRKVKREVNIPRGVDGETGINFDEFAESDSEELVGPLQGLKGDDAGTLAIYTNEIEGEFIINGRGQKGGPGGKGGKGGRGGNGGRGQYGTKDQDSCNGGNGGNGGKGGTGGRGGTGGAALNFFLVSPQKSEVKLDRVMLLGGLGGDGGEAGEGGNPGLGGEGGGQEEGMISAADADGGQGRGVDGVTGSPGEKGPTGSVGNERTLVRPAIDRDFDKYASAIRAIRAFHHERTFWALVERSYTMVDRALVTHSIREENSKEFLDASAQELALMSVQNPETLGVMVESWKSFAVQFEASQIPGDKEFSQLAHSVPEALDLIRSQSVSVEVLKQISSRFDELTRKRYVRLSERISDLERSCADYALNRAELIRSTSGVQTGSVQFKNYLINRIYSIPACDNPQKIVKNPLGSIELAYPLLPYADPADFLKTVKTHPLKIYGVILKDPLSWFKLFAPTYAQEVGLESADEQLLLNAEWGLRDLQSVSFRFLVGTSQTSQRVTASGVLRAFHGIDPDQIKTPEQLDIYLRLLALMMKSNQLVEAKR